MRNLGHGVTVDTALRSGEFRFASDRSRIESNASVVMAKIDCFEGWIGIWWLGDPIVRYPDLLDNEGSRRPFEEPCPRRWLTKGR